MFDVTASLAGLLTWPGGGPYAASKHAIVAVAEQAALGFQDTDVHVTVSCPTLRSGMPPEGLDPADVTATALAAVDEGRFIIMPDEWRLAVHERAKMTETGMQPSLPMPTAADSGAR
jgi:NAD(P)-dependent dehydrogenase (short-subunit alcohol dehydrogenase family)